MSIAPFVPCWKHIPSVTSVCARSSATTNSRYHDKIKVLRGYALRAPEDWRCRIKSRSEERRFIDLVRFSFARYRVAAHLENAWIDRFTDDLVDRVGELPEVQPMRGSRPDLRRWYL